jgi:hypothetical protein
MRACLGQVHLDAMESESQARAERFHLQVAMSGAMSTRGGGSKAASSCSGMEAHAAQVLQFMRPILVHSVSPCTACQAMAAPRTAL